MKINPLIATEPPADLESVVPEGGDSVDCLVRKYRLLEDGEPIGETDDVLTDACDSWEPVRGKGTRWPIGCPYDPKFFKPMRREILQGDALKKSSSDPWDGICNNLPPGPMFFTDPNAESSNTGLK